MNRLVEIVRADPAIESLTAVTGGGSRNSGTMFVALKPLKERRVSAGEIVARLRTQLAKEPGVNLWLVPVQDVRIGGRQGTGLVPVHAAERRPRGAADLDGAAAGCAPERAAADRRQHRPGDARPADDGRDRPADRGAARHHPGHDRHHARERVRTIGGVDDLHRAQPVSRGDGGRSALRGGARGAQGHLRAQPRRNAGAAFDRGALRVHQHPAVGEPPGPVRRLDDLVQPAGRRFAVDRDRGDQRDDGAHRRCRRRSTAASRAPRAASRRRSHASHGSFSRRSSRCTSSSACSTRARFTRSRSCRRCRRRASARCSPCSRSRSSSASSR